MCKTAKELIDALAQYLIKLSTVLTPFPIQLNIASMQTDFHVGVCSVCLKQSLKSNSIQWNVALSI